MKDKSLYFIAIIPPEPLRTRIMDIKHETSTLYHTYHSLKSPPHITLIPPFMFAHHKEQKIRRILLDIGSSCEVFDVSIFDYGAFKPRVIYLNILKNETLERLQGKLADICSRELEINMSKSLPFNPHITLAFRDLSPQMFFKAWEKYRSEDFQSSFTAKSLFVLKHNGTCWDIAMDVPFTLPG